MRHIDKIVVPPTYMPTLLTVIHLKCNHPSKYQMAHRCHHVSDRTSGVAAEGWKEAPDAGKVPRLGQPDRRGAGAGYWEEEKDEE
jgi:hypothetical protein